MKQTKKCLFCGKDFSPKVSKQKFCNKICYEKNPKMWLIGNKFREKKSSWNKGIPQSKEAKRKVKEKLKGRMAWNKGLKRYWDSPTEFKKGENLSEKHWLWKGENASYRSIHHWVDNHFGKPQECNQCGKTSGRFNWSNKDHKYRRNLDDYIRLCVSCHRKKDIALKKNEFNSVEVLNG